MNHPKTSQRARLKERNHANKQTHKLYKRNQIRTTRCLNGKVITDGGKQDK